MRPDPELTVTSATETQQWLVRFAGHLMQLQPDVRLSLAFARAAAMRPHAKDLAPEKAAQLDAAARDRAAFSPPPVAR
jgi:hypothetical protein